ncbi:MAG: nitroreductase family protein [Tannerellaceae bacterium]|nr:nitroreductase family protein [Tannerellaceae bacterium]
MKLLDLSRKRCSIRKYDSRPVEDEKLDYILETARMAQSAVNYQPWYFLVIRQEAGRENVCKCYPREWMKPAPLYIVVCGDHQQSWKRPSDGKDHLDIDAGIATEHICLAAAELDLGCCCVCNFDKELFSKLFHLPEHIEPIAIMPVGYPTDPELFNTTPKKRKPLEELVIREKF